jgi:hypothetical protein
MVRAGAFGVSHIANNSSPAARGATCRRRCGSDLVLNEFATDPLLARRLQKEGSAVCDVQKRVSVRGQWWAMRDGTPGNYGTPGNKESVSYRFQEPLVGSNPTLAAIPL